MTRFAEKTAVASATSRVEIERTLARYGADGFMYGWADDSAVVAFRMSNRHIKFVLPLPDRQAREFTHTPERDTERSASKAEGAYEQAVRQRWRALALVIKAKLEAVESGITEFDDEFLAHIVLPDGKTVGQVMGPQIAIAYDSGKMPPLLGYDGASS
jgi:hypothetical protein